MALSRNQKIAIGAGVAVLGVFVIAREVEKRRKQKALDAAKAGGDFKTVFETITADSPVIGSGAQTISVPTSASLPLCTTMFPDTRDGDGNIIPGLQLGVEANRTASRIVGRCR